MLFCQEKFSQKHEKIIDIISFSYIINLWCVIRRKNGALEYNILTRGICQAFSVINNNIITRCKCESNER